MFPCFYGNLGVSLKKLKISLEKKTLTSVTNRWSLNLENIKSLTKKQREFEKKQEVLEGIMKHWEMSLATYYITRFQNTPLEVRHLNMNQKARIRCLELDNIKETINKIFKKTTAIPRNLSSFLLYSKVPKDSIHSNTLTSLTKHQIGFYNRKTLNVFEKK